jgi:NAD(P) transhydrogenase subunit alpha
VTDNGVVILGYTDLPGRLPQQASQLFGTNMLNLLKLLTPDKNGKLTIDFEDVVQRSVTVVQDGAVTWPPPPVQVSAAPVAAAAEPVVVAEKRQMSARQKGLLTGLGLAIVLAVTAFAPAPLPQHFLVLMLSVVVGFYVIGKVHHALHTPLMSVTNAISGIIVVGAIGQLASTNVVVQVMAAVGVLLASINIFGGFAVTRRMLKMFSKGGNK